MAAANLVRPGSAHCLLCVSVIKANLQSGIAMRGARGRVETCEGSCGGVKPSATAAGASARRVPVMSSLSCRGMQELLTVTLPPTLPWAVELYTLPQAACLGAFASREVVPSSRALEVPAPPPRLALALS